ncbi:class I SAM-dependent methyltransferase [Caenimonas sedimenti]|uniref:Class I SAM-dependent methyltransferase n=1 Tax=Caenimonas sedimenti TaxID=2596921 RepID=A0A562ZLA3_9BURK|nr:class I SAM-dependent methyltransferase [Caenimonas sedimenti]TWO68954.1 class I SAM-dependent methyltransferase [Caenimonas sedimenti]
MAEPSFDPVWDTIYGGGHTVRYPWDAVVSFVFRHAPRGVPRASVRILEVGCGSASNLWFAAREGFCVTGIDGSAAAIAQARRRFADEGLSGDLRVGDFTRLDGLADASFDLVIDRGALVCTGYSDAARAVREIGRVLKPGGRFFFNPYSDRHTSASSGRAAADGLRVGIDKGSLVGVGQLCFYGRDEVDGLLREGWVVRSLQHLELQEALDGSLHAEWRVVAEKPA